MRGFLSSSEPSSSSSSSRSCFFVSRWRRLSLGGLGLSGPPDGEALRFVARSGRERRTTDGGWARTLARRASAVSASTAVPACVALDASAAAVILRLAAVRQLAADLELV